MKLKLLLLLLLVVSFSVFVSAQKKPYNNLIITEAEIADGNSDYVEFTNMGTETIDLSEFEFGTISPWDQPWTPAGLDYSVMLPKKMLAPGKSFVIATGKVVEPRNWIKDPLRNMERITIPEFYKLADLICYAPETGMLANDTITPWYHVLNLDNGRDCLYLRHHYINTDGLKDSMIIDQVGGIFDEADGTSANMAHDVAGVVNATDQNILIRKSIIKTGISEFSSHDANAAAAKMQFSNNRGLDFADSEWIPVPILSVQADYPAMFWRAAFWTVGNQGDYKLDANTLVSKTGKVIVDLSKSTITEPWGIRRNDSIMYQFIRRPGLAWEYSFVGTKEDSAYVSARTGDQLTLYVCGNEVTVKKFNIIVQDPTPSDNIVIPKNTRFTSIQLTTFGNPNPNYTKNIWPYHDIRISNGVAGMDTISRIDFAMRSDTLIKYLEKAPKASWKIVFKDGVEKPDLKNGDLLRVTSENGNVKDYFLKIMNFRPDANAFLTSITWPDIPTSFKGAIAGVYGWKGDTIPGFTPSKNIYVVNIPMDYEGIPALMFTKQQPSSNVVVTRAKTMGGSVADRTVTFTVTAEDNTTVNVYTVRFDKEKDPKNTQPYIGEPFFSQYVYSESWTSNYLEIANPGTAPMDLSNYMIVGGWGDPADIFTYGTGLTGWKDAYYRYVPGKKWQDEANWMVQPSILEPDLGTSSIVYPGDVFVMANWAGGPYNDKTHGNGDSEYRKEFDVDFQRNPWGRTVPNQNVITCGPQATICMYKILSDSVKNGLKPATNPSDFELIETWGTGGAYATVKVGGIDEVYVQSNTRKPNVYKPNPIVGGSNGATLEDSEWIPVTSTDLANMGYGWPEMVLRVCDGLGSHVMDEVTINKSTVTSVVYKVSPGYSQNETIKGLTTGTTVTGFYNNIIKANPLQTFKVKSASNGIELDAAAAISNGDFLIVLSADSTNTSKYTLDVSINGLSANALLTSTNYTVNVNGITGTISGFNQGTLLKTIVADIVVPAGATMSITDASDAYMSFIRLNYDTVYVNVVATDNIYFEVIAENGITKITYQLIPTANSSDAYVTSDVYSVDQDANLIQFIPGASSVYTLMSNLTSAPGATMKVYDKAGFVRTEGTIYKDDKLLVTSKDGTNSKGYYFSILNFNVNTYLAYVTSDVYKVDQVALTIKLPTTSADLGEFYSKLNPSYGASLMVLDKNGNPVASTVEVGNKLQVIAADNSTTVVYEIGTSVGVSTLDNTEMIKMYPNPTTDRVVINGLAKGNRVQVFNTVGVTLRDVIVDNSTEHVSLSAQPAGIYIFVISSGDQHINIQKIVKK